jgi:hypothetical protein|tara:strand:+ start:1846 stop:2241 length:396 start_codon:yes stop_codon:yes gene_type:complete
MLLGHGSIGQFSVAEALPGFVVNIGTVGIDLGQTIGTISSGTLTMTGTANVSPTGSVGTFSLGTEVATGGANVSPTTAGSITASVGEETAFGEAFQNLISFSVGSPDFFLWNEVDDSADATWKPVDPGSTD